MHSCILVSWSLFKSSCSEITSLLNFSEVDAIFSAAFHFPRCVNSLLLSSPHPWMFQDRFIVAIWKRIFPLILKLLPSLSGKSIVFWSWSLEQLPTLVWWYNIYTQFSSVQSLSHVRLIATPWITACQASLSITNSRSSLTLTSIESVMASSHLILCRPQLLLPSIRPRIRVFSNESTLHMRWPKYWSFSFSIIPSKEIPGLISFRMDWLDLLAVEGTLKSVLQHHSSKAPILRRSAFFTVQLSHPYMTTGKTIALTRRTFVAILLGGPK